MKSEFDEVITDILENGLNRISARRFANLVDAIRPYIPEDKPAFDAEAEIADLRNMIHVLQIFTGMPGSVDRTKPSLKDEVASLRAEIEAMKKPQSLIDAEAQKRRAQEHPFRDAIERSARANQEYPLKARGMKDNFNEMPNLKPGESKE